jgi:hypothetical protein
MLLVSYFHFIKQSFKANNKKRLGDTACRGVFEPFDFLINLNNDKGGDI